MQAITTIGLDIAKSVFQVRRCCRCQVIICRQLKRCYVLTFFQKLVMADAINAVKDLPRPYSGYLTMSGPDVLELKGCVLGGIICKSETWTRAR